ncbi:IPT/TIG domain-containing protein [Pontibacter sp. G13]|uniref:IPT/TIG domain-containing protein n=1 Tax=Pontibacter sp. G13 TaxID=3074898 RepID=UPI00288907B2|nr:IPT/TIG domain-containing protein [Pontibacter sp. G13]WNJ19693.1 IPT/TIG domain-containing protein [Pontibacter sp. G13]
MNYSSLKYLLLGVMGLWVAACQSPKLGPELTVLEPDFGPAETLVTIEGQHLANIQSITFSGQSINFNSAYNADHALLFRIPTDVPLGPHEVVITTPNGEVKTDFRVTHEPPEVFEIFPESGAPGDVVTLRGAHFFSPVEVYFHDSVEAEILVETEDSLLVRVPEGIERGYVQVKADGGAAFSPQRFFTVSSILINDFDGNGLRSETHKWIFVGSVDQTAQNAVHQSDPEPVSGNFLKISGSDDLGINWIGGAQNHFGFPGDEFETFGIQTAANNTLLELDVHNNGRDQTHLILILQEKDGSPNDFAYQIPVDWDGWKRVSVPLNRFKDLNDVIIDPAKVRVVKMHLIDEAQSGGKLEVNVDNLQFIELL